MAEPAPVTRDPGASGASAPKADPVSSATIAERAVVISLGDTGKKKIKKLKRGTGSLVDEVREAVELAAANMGDDASGKVLVPTVLVYREKAANKKVRRGGTYGMCPLCCL